MARKKQKTEQQNDKKAKGIDLESENIALKEMLQRAQADLINFRKRTEREKPYIEERSKLELIRSLLEVFVNFEKAREHFPKELEKNEWAKGMLAIEDQFAKKLKEIGIEKMDVIGKHFNPHLHEIVDIGELDPQGENKITKEYEAGYIYKDKVTNEDKVLKVAKVGLK